MFERYYGSGRLETKTTKNGAEKLKQAITEADAVVIGAGAGLSTAAGYYYSGERFERYLWDFHEKYGINDMYSGGFYPFSSAEERFAWWSRCIWLNRYTAMPSPLYQELFQLVREKDYFVLTTNVDHCFQRAGFDKARLFYTQGDYGLWQCPEPCHEETWDNEEDVRRMLPAQGFLIGERYVDPAKVPSILESYDVPHDRVIHILIDEDAEQNLRPARLFMGLLAHNGYTRSVLVSKKRAESHVRTEEEMALERQRQYAPSPRRVSPSGKRQIRYKSSIE